MIEPVSIQVRIVETLESAATPERRGTPTAYFHRWLQAIQTAVNLLIAAVEALSRTAAGTASDTPSGSGYIDIAHGLSVTPSLGRCRAQTVGTSFANTQLVSVGATTLRVILLDAAGSAITTGTWTVAWEVGA